MSAHNGKQGRLVSAGDVCERTSLAIGPSVAGISDDVVAPV